MSAAPQAPLKPRRSTRKRIQPVSQAVPSANHALPPADSNTRPDWQFWSSHLAARKAPGELRQFFPRGNQAALLWALEEAARPAWFDLPASELAGHVAQFLDGAPAPAPSVPFAIECLTWCHRLPALAAHCQDEPWWRLLERLVETAHAAAGISLADEPLEHQLLAGELPLTLAYLFPELPQCRELTHPALAALSRGPTELLDGEGAPPARFWPLLRPLLAVWTRAEIVGRELAGSCFSGDAQAQYEWLVRHALRTTRHDGRLVLAPGETGDWCPDLFAAALAVRGDWEDAQIADCALPGRRSSRQPAARRELPAPPTHSEPSESGLLRYDWHRGSDFLAVLFHGRHIQAELNCGPDNLWSGAWDPTLAIDGQTLSPISAWQEICWHTDDDDVIYLELEMSFTDGWRIQRQLLLAGQDRFLLACDSVLGARSAHIDYRCTLPLSASTQFEPAEETREGLLVTGRRKRLVLPLALPEWRTASSGGALSSGDEGLTLTQSATAAGLFAPLWIDLDPRRIRQQRTWRKLTIAEQLQNVPVDVAAAYRVQIGGKQWLVYRSFRQPSNRSVLGQNVANECLVARFLRTGDVDELLEIE